MLPQNNERLKGPEVDFAIAVHELKQVTGALREWQTGGAADSTSALVDLQRSLDRIIEVESGTYAPQSVHPHNGYYAGDFSSVPFRQPDLRALAAPTRGVTGQSLRFQA